MSVTQSSKHSIKQKCKFCLTTNFLQRDSFCMISNSGSSIKLISPLQENQPGKEVKGVCECAGTQRKWQKERS